jgi:hypothetical protein
MAAEFPVVHFKIHHRATGLTPPVVPTQRVREVSGLATDRTDRAMTSQEFMRPEVDVKDW